MKKQFNKADMSLKEVGRRMLEGGFMVVKTSGLIIAGVNDGPANNCNGGNCPTNNCDNGNCGNCVKGCGVKT